jgi:hypothetical protein
MAEAKPGSGRLQALLLAVVFLGPLAIAFWMYYGEPSLAPEGRTNHGALLEPIVNVADRVPESTLFPAAERRWLLIYRNTGECGEECLRSLYTIRQLRLMLGREMSRLDRVFLHGSDAPDTLSARQEYEGLIAVHEPGVGDLLAAKTPAGLEPGGYYLVDPNGNLVMYFDPGLEPGDIVDDIKKLLRLSRIG